MPNKSSSVTYFQALKEIFGPLRVKKHEWQKMSINSNCKFCKKKNAKNCDVKTLQTIPLSLETLQ